MSAQNGICIGVLESAEDDAWGWAEKVHCAVRVDGEGECETRGALLLRWGGSSVRPTPEMGVFYDDIGEFRAIVEASRRIWRRLQ